MSRLSFLAVVLPLFAALAGCRLPADRSLVRDRTAALYGILTNGATAAPRINGAEDAPAIAPDALLAAADLELYRRFGLRHNGGLRAAYERWRAALERPAQVGSLPDPVFSFGQFVEEVQTRTGPQQRRYSLSQTFPWFGKLGLRSEVAMRAAEELWHEVGAARLRVEREIELAYFEYAYLAQSIRIERGVLDLLKQLEPAVQQRIVGGAGRQDLLRLQVEIGQLENELASLEKARPALSAKLAAAMNWPGREWLPLPELTEPPVRSLDVDALMRQAEQHNPELLQIAEEIRRGQDTLQLAELDGWPDLTVGVDYLETGDAAGPVVGSGDDPWSVRLMFNLPLWRGRYRAATREAERTVAAASHSLADRRATLQADVEHAVFKIDDAARQLVLYRDTLLPRAREALAVTRAAYRAGTASLLDLIDSERALLGFETGYWRACRDQHQGRARLEALVGHGLQKGGL